MTCDISAKTTNKFMKASKTKFCYKPLLLLAILSLSSCTSNSTLTIEKFRDLAINSTKSDIEEFSDNQKLLQHHERSNIEWTNSSGNVVKSYNHSERKLGILSYLPLLSFLLPRNYENYEVIITSKNGSIVDVQSFYGVITLASESSCNEAIFSCVINAK